ncbi:hypothetical protein Mapa_017036 [Marchantia paleacea]|nr:hypothetical protein Mapa_017036 [Marchantia paleacea]
MQMSKEKEDCRVTFSFNHFNIESTFLKLWRHAFSIPKFDHGSSTENYSCDNMPIALCCSSTKIPL